MDNLIQYAKTINLSADGLVWLNTTGAKYLKLNKVSESELEHVLDYFVSSQAPRRLLKMSLDDALKKSKSWSESNQKKGRDLIDSELDIETVLTFESGDKIVLLKTKSAFEREGYLMSHCLGGYNPHTSDMLIYSYRDSDNNPHATFEVKKTIMK